MANDNYIDYPEMVRQREEAIQQGEVARAEDVNIEFNHIVTTFNMLVSMLEGEWGGTGRIYELVDNAVSKANEALSKVNNCVLKTGDTLSGQLNQPNVPSSNYNLVNKKYVDDKINEELLEPNSKIEDISARVDELFQSVSDGKSKVAAAITDKGVSTAANATFDTMASNIRSIPVLDTSDATAKATDIKLGKSAYVDGNKIYGVHEDVAGTDTTDANATPSDIRTGKSAYVNGQKLIGTLDVTTGGTDIGAVEKVYSEVTDKINRSVGTTRLPTGVMGVASYDGEAASYYITSTKVESTNKIQVYALSNGTAYHIKTWNASEWGIPADTEDTTYTIKSIRVSTLSKDVRYAVIIGTKTKTSVNTVYMQACRISLESLQDDTAVTTALTIVPYWYEEQGKPETQKHVDMWYKELTTCRYVGDNLADVAFFEEPNNLVVAIIDTNANNTQAYIKYYTLYLLYEAGGTGLPVQIISSGSVEGAFYSLGVPSIMLRRSGELVAINCAGKCLLLLLDEIYSVVASSELPGIAHVSNDGTKAIVALTQIVRYIITIDVDNPAISVDVDRINGLTDALYTDEYISGYSIKYIVGSVDDKFILFIGNNGNMFMSEPSIGVVYGLDFNSNDILHILNYYDINTFKYGSISYNMVGDRLIKNPNNLCFINTSGNFVEFIPVIDYQEIVGLRYEGRMYYDLSKLRLTATQSDVTYGKYFVGKAGVKEIGSKIEEDK